MINFHEFSVSDRRDTSTIATTDFKTFSARDQWTTQTEGGALGGEQMFMAD